MDVSRQLQGNQLGLEELQKDHGLPISLSVMTLPLFATLPILLWSCIW